MIIGLTFNQIFSVILWAYIAGFITSCALCVVIENKKEKDKHKELRARIKKLYKNFDAKNLKYNPDFIYDNWSNLKNNPERKN